MAVDIRRPAQHGSLTHWQQPPLEAPGVGPQLLPVEFPDLKHAKPSKERVRMIPAPPPSHQTREPFLVPEENPPQGPIPPSLKVPPHHQAVLKVWKDKPIIE